MNRFVLDSSVKYLNSSHSLSSMSKLSLNITKLILLDHDIDAKFQRSIEIDDYEIAELLYPYIRSDCTKRIAVIVIYNFLVPGDRKLTVDCSFISPILSLLVKDNVDTYIHWVPLHELICAYGFIDIIKILIDNGMQIRPDGYLETRAMFYGKYELARYLFELGTHKDIDLRLCSDNYDMTKFLLERNVRTKIDLALNQACCNNNIAVAKLLLEYGAETDSTNDEYALCCAIKNQNKELISLLRRHGSSMRKAKYFNDNNGYDRYHLYTPFDGDDDSVIVTALNQWIDNLLLKDQEQ